MEEEWILSPEKIQPSFALTHPNVEKRRALCEIVGWDKILQSLEVKIINEDSDAEIGTLVSANLPGEPDSKFLKVRCGTGRNFVLPVPPTMRTALEANAWTWGLDSNEYSPEVRT